ncbi:MAG TPA: hypothetical protein DCE42_05310 [Myxococcales bacterium]|nr:hypothetical protein [Deltaproteobacteria bacterium]MBK07334.1 hypothetical protein [Deltaproteobacteria bacterium]MBU53248.1 hypothetical protein [Deltaproteobacteria bacterium]HAA54150.1 hypothetical protein [Myxococcales bacterium]
MVVMKVEFPFQLYVDGKLYDEYTNEEAVQKASCLLSDEGHKTEIWCRPSKQSGQRAAYIKAQIWNVVRSRMGASAHARDAEESDGCVGKQR